MSNFWIKRIAAYRNDGVVSEIDLVNGLNCIIGPSNTGKSRIAKAVLYACGGDDAPFVESDNYNKISVEFVCEKGHVVISRTYEPQPNKVYEKTGEINQRPAQSKFWVDSTVEGILTGKYIKSGNKDNSIGTVLMKLLGFDNHRQVITNQSYGKQNLTWGSLKHLMVITEDLIGRPDPSILFPRSANLTSKTANVSALTVLAQDENYNDIESSETEREKRARRKAVRSYINRQMKLLNERYDEVIGLISDAQERNDDPHEFIESLKVQLEIANAARDEVLKTSGKIAADISECNRHLEEANISLVTSLSLQSQYSADVKRLDFQLDAARYHEAHEQVHTCQFCHSEITDNNELMPDESLVAQEKEKLEALLSDVSNNITYLKSQISELENHKIDLSARYDLQVARLKTELDPALENLQNKINAFVEVENLLAEKNQIELFKERYINTLNGNDEEEDERESYNPFDEFKPSFYLTMTNLVQDILEACQYSGAVKTTFVKETLDLRIGLADKKDVEGKGYCAYLNTTNSLAFHRYLNENSVHAPGMLLIDTPFHGFDEGEGSDLRDGMMRYMLNQSKEQQIIILENTRHFRKLLFGDGYHQIEFTHDKNVGRYGFLEGVYDASEAEHHE